MLTWDTPDDVRWLARKDPCRKEGRREGADFVLTSFRVCCRRVCRLVNGPTFSANDVLMQSTVQYTRPSPLHSTSTCVYCTSVVGRLFTRAHADEPQYCYSKRLNSLPYIGSHRTRRRLPRQAMRRCSLAPLPYVPFSLAS